MTKQIILLAECPYCEENGELFLDTREADHEHLERIPKSDFEAGPNQRIIVYNSHRPECGPCGHFVDLYGDINWEGDPSREQCFHWRAPIRAEIDPDESGFYHLLDLYDAESRQKKKTEESQELRAATDKTATNELDYEEYLDYEDHLNAAPDLMNRYAYRPQVRYSEFRFWDTWQDFATEGRPRSCEVAGQIVFAEDVREFFRELRSLSEKLASDYQAEHTA
jgi:hypothetical protein